jgi:hypothetical protein
LTKGPLNLAGLLKDVSDQPDTPVTTPISLDVLRDANVTPEKAAWRGQLPKMMVALVGLIVLGGASTVAVKLRDGGTDRLVPTTHAPTKEPTPAKQNDQPPVSDRSAYSKPVQELMQYIDDLKAGRVAFGAGITGEEAAKQLGYSRLFASAYEEVILRTKARLAKAEQDGGPSINDIVGDFEGIMREEQAIDRLLAQKERHAAAIAYLRALQNGDVVFPLPQAWAPIPEILLAQLMSAYPDASIEINDPVFARIYRDTREFVSTQLDNAGEVWPHQIIAEFRRLIVESAASAGGVQPSVCDQGRQIGEMVVVAQFCPRLRVSPLAQKAAEEVARQANGVACRDNAAVARKTALDAMPIGEITKMCESVEQHVRSGNVAAFELTK